MRFSRHWLLVAALCAAGFFIPFRFDTDALFYIHLMDAAHLPAFFALTLFAHRFWPWETGACRRRIFSAGAIALASTAIEVVQPLFGRSESWTDLINGISGIFLAVVWLAARESARPTAVRIVFLLCTVCATAMAFSPAWKESEGLRWRRTNFPILADFETEAELRLWVGSGLGNKKGDGTAVERVMEHASRGAWALKVVATPAAEWPGVRLLNGKQDWRGFSSLVFEVWNPSEEFELSIRVDDDFQHQHFQDRFNSSFPIKPGANRITIPLSEIETRPKNRRMNLSAIRRTILYVNRPQVERTFFLDHMRLE
jgi:hypothetical protein